MSRFVSAALFGAALLISGNAFAAKYDAAAGKATYDASCAMCHKTGMMGAPKLGDKAAWKSHIAKGMDAMVANSIKGYKGPKGMMPAKGGNPKLTDAQVGNAVAYMVGQSK
ncbi:MAG: cytochrome c5 family protein [Chlorobiaceae bacterium]|nr:cytochrome c5 family protein [Chlorobiaceae bacterium]